MANGHPSDDIRGSLGNELAGRRIVLCVTGSVAAVRSPDIARLLIRHGAEVFPVMSSAACSLIRPELLHWATGNFPVTELSGAIEHVQLAGNVPNKADLILVAPATANTIGKIAAAIDDTPVTTVVTTALGEGIPMVVVPAMHEPMYRHPLVAANIARLEGIGVRFVMPHIAEGKAKIASEEEVLASVLDRFRAEGSLRGRRVLVTAGRTVEYLDPVRVITNNSSGKMGIAVAEAAAAAGASVTLVCGKISVPEPRGIHVIRTDTAEEMARAVNDELDKNDYNIVVATAAVGDWMPEKTEPSKISTHDREVIELRLVPTPKIIDSIKATHPEVFLVAFRALTGLTPRELIENAYDRMEKAGADLIAVNEVTGEGVGFEGDTNELYVVDRQKKAEHIPLTTKRAVADRLIALIGDYQKYH